MSKSILNSEEIDIFLEKNSFSGLLALYAFYLASTSQKGFTFETLEKKVDFLPNQYSLAFFVVSQALGFLKHTTNNNTGQTVYNVISYDVLLGQKVKTAVYKKADQNDTLFPKKMEDNIKLLWKSKIEQLELYFA